MMTIPTDLTTQIPQELYTFIRDLETYKITDGRGRTPEASHVRLYVSEETIRVKIELTRRGLPRVEPGRERSYGPGQAGWQKDAKIVPSWVMAGERFTPVAHMFPEKIWNRPKTTIQAVCGTILKHPWTGPTIPAAARLCPECVRLTGYEVPEPDPEPSSEGRECPLKCIQGVVGRSPEGELVFCSCGPGRRAEIAWWEADLAQMEKSQDPSLKSAIFVAKHWITELQAQLHRREGAWADYPDHPFEGAVRAREEWVEEAIANLEEEHLAKVRAAIVDSPEDEAHEESRSQA